MIKCQYTQVHHTDNNDVTNNTIVCNIYIYIYIYIYILLYSVNFV